MYQYLFGPVPSRRLGMSLGVDLVPKKVCSLDCVYCEVGKTTQLTTERGEFVPFDAIKRELVDYFSHDNSEPECITFSGFGEPTLNSELSAVIELIRHYRPHISIAMITNGTLFADPEVRRSLLATNIVMPSLDAVDEKVFMRINRPARSIDLSACIQGLIDFRREYTGKIYLEVFIIPGYNDGTAHLQQLRQVLLQVNADKVQLNTLDRPGTIHRIRAATAEELQRVVSLLNLDNVEVIAKVKPCEEPPHYRQDAAAVIYETIVRRPCTTADLQQILGLSVTQIENHLSALDLDHKIERVKQQRGIFYRGI